MDREIRLHLSESLLQDLKNAAQANSVSVNRFISLAVTEKLSALQVPTIIWDPSAVIIFLLNPRRNGK